LDKENRLKPDETEAGMEKNVDGNESEKSDKASGDASDDANVQQKDGETSTDSAGDGASGDASGETAKETKKDPKDVLIEELTDKNRRQMAEFDNFRKRTEKEKASMYEFGARDVIEKILPVVDSFERGLASISDEDKGSPFADGMDKVYKQLAKALEDMGVKPIEAVNQEFDPNLHNAVMHVEDDTVGDNVIVEELQKGYTYRETVVRHSMVKVAN
jgi:molecular chaperone GrpE